MKVSYTRRYDLDALKVVGTALIFLFHCIQPFNPLEEWHLSNGMRSSILGSVNSYLNFWIMPLFMLLAGSSSFYALQKRTYFAYVKERILRILIPCVFGVLVLVPPQVYWERLRKGQFQGTFFQFYPHFFEGIYPSGNFSWHHLWFLVYLFTYAMVGLFFFYLFKTPFANTTIHRLAGLVSRNVQTLIVFIVPAIFFQVVLGKRYPQTNAFLGDWAWHAQLFLAFLTGYVLVADKRYLETLAKFWQTTAFLAIAMSTLVLNADPELLDRWLRAVLYRFSTWMWIFAALGFAYRFLNSKSGFISYSARAALPFYILHQTFIVGFSFWVLELKQPVFVKFPLIFTLSFLGTLLAYEFLKRILLLRIFLGLKN